MANGNVLDALGKEAEALAVWEQMKKKADARGMHPHEYGIMILVSAWTDHIEEHHQANWGKRILVGAVAAVAAYLPIGTPWDGHP